MTVPRLLLLATLPFLASVATAASAGRTNVLFIISDDLNNRQGCYGDPIARTPNIDRLAARGARFDRAYCTYTLCGPSRNSMLTGLYPNSTGILGNSQLFRQSIPDHISLPQAFRHDGYLAVRLGKLYHYAVPIGIGTDGHDDPASWEMEFNPAGVDRLAEEKKVFTVIPGSYGATLSWLASPSPDSAHTDGMLADQAEWILERCAARKDRPFFVALGFFRPHTPFVAPKDPYFGYYPESEMPVVRGVEADQQDLPPAALSTRRREDEQLDDNLRRQAVQAYYASISFVDAQVGRVVDALDRLGLAENTVIVFTSDHGFHLGEHGLWKKHTLFEESARVPLIVVAPGVTRGGSVVKAPVSHVDLYPTLAELAGVKTPDNLQGQSLVSLLKDPSAAGRGWAFTQVVRSGGGDGSAGSRKAAATEGDRAGRKKAVAAEEQGARGRYFGYSLRTSRWRYTEWGDDGRLGRELYDHDADPKELTNLAAAPAHAATVQELSRKLAAAAKSTYPASGQIPERRDIMWSPVLVK